MATAQTPDSLLYREVEVIRTAHGVPHIRAQNLRAGVYALAWLQLEDHGPRTAMNVLTRELVTVEFKNGPGLSSETREFWSTPLGPVIHRANGKIYVLRTAGEGGRRPNGPWQSLVN